MSCSNCFNGCTEITSDKCVKYTGADIPALGIQNGDTLLFVEQALAQFLITTLNGTGIKPIVDLQGVCSIVANNIPVCVGCTGPTLNDLLQALIGASCDLQDLINGVVGNIETLEGPYNEGCLTVVDATFSNTHNVLQAVIDQLCQTDELLGTTILSLSNYVPLTGPNNVNDIINKALEDAGLIGPVTKQYTKMVPYTAIPWFAPASYFSGKFDGSGKGLDAGDFQYIYLCNGLNNTPDMRGRVPAGLTDGGMFGLTMDANVNPGSSLLNPIYSLGAKHGVNYITLGVNEMPTHTHVVIDNEHSHFTTALGAGPFVYQPNNTTPIVWNRDYSDFGTYRLSGTSGALATVGLSSLSQSNISLEPTGDSEAHINTQPTIGCYYIMYIPAP